MNAANRTFFPNPNLEILDIIIDFETSNVNVRIGLLKTKMNKEYGKS
jgi:hypothetical protein